MSFYFLCAAVLLVVLAFISLIVGIVFSLYAISSKQRKIGVSCIFFTAAFSIPAATLGEISAKMEKPPCFVDSMPLDISPLCREISFLLDDVSNWEIQLEHGTCSNGHIKIMYVWYWEHPRYYFDNKKLELDTMSTPDWVYLDKKVNSILSPKVKKLLDFKLMAPQYESDKKAAILAKERKNRFDKRICDKKYIAN